MKILNRHKWNSPTSHDQTQAGTIPPRIVEQIGFRFLIATLIVVSLAGCGDKAIAPAVAKKSKFKPKFAVNGETITEESTEKSLLELGNLAFLNRDHFACLRIPLADLKAMKDLSEIPWNDLNGALEQLVGKDQNPDEIKNLYIVLDGQFLKIDDFESCVGYLAEFADSVARENTNVDPTKAVDEDEDEKNSRRILGDKLIAYGPKPVIDKLRDDSPASDIAVRLAKSKSDGSICGAVSMQPIRSTLKGIFSMVATMQPAMKSFAHIPDDIESIWFSLDIAEDRDFFNLQMDILNDELRKQIFESLDQAIANSADISSLAAAIPGSSESMISPKTPNSMFSVFKEVGENSLLTTSVSGQRLSVNILRPKKLEQLIASVVSDYAEQAALQKRLQGAQKIADSLRSYFEEHGTLPPLGIVKSGDNLPAQFNWRIGLAKYSEHNELYDQFDFQQDWDENSNLQITQQLSAELPLGSFDINSGSTGLYQNMDSRPNLKMEGNKNWTAIAIERKLVDEAWAKPPTEFVTIDTTQLGKADENGIIVITASFEVRLLKRASGKIESILSTDGGERLKSGDFFKF